MGSPGRPGPGSSVTSIWRPVSRRKWRLLRSNSPLLCSVRIASRTVPRVLDAWSGPPAAKGHHQPIIDAMRTGDVDRPARACDSHGDRSRRLEPEGRDGLMAEALCAGSRCRAPLALTMGRAVPRPVFL